MPDDALPTDRARLVRDLGEAVRELTLESDRLAHRFAAGHDLHQTDFTALTLVYGAEKRGDPLTPGRLAASLSLSSGAVTYLVERLVSSGHVRREPDPRDRRRVVLRYADHGHEVAAGFFGPLGRHLGARLAGHDDAALAAALDVITVMRDAMAAYETPDA